MNAKKFSEAMSELDSKYIDEAVRYRKKTRKPVWVKLGAAAACLALVLYVGSILVPSHEGMIVLAYAYGTDEEITTAGAVMSSGTINDRGVMKGSPLMFYLSGKDIASVRFSCKNQQINFMDWTEKRDEYGNAQNFTVAYGEDESEYYYLTINWVPNTLIRELTDNADSAIATLPEEMRHDTIVMEIVFEDGKTATKAITISLLDDGTFLATFGDYQISEADTFVNRPDSAAIPRDILYSQGGLPGEETIQLDPSDAASTATKDSTEGLQKGIITFSGTIVENTIETLGHVILVKPHENEIPYDAVFFELSDKDADWVMRIGEDVTITCLDTFTESAPYFGTLISITEEAAHDELSSAQNLSAAEEAARAYYADTVFEILSLELERQTENEVVFSVCVSKGGVVQEPNRTITLQQDNQIWEVVNEGY